MDKDAYLEINASQRPALALFEAMGYTYISPADCDKQRGSRYHVLLRDILRGQLRRLNRYVYAGAENEFSAANIAVSYTHLDVYKRQKGDGVASPVVGREGALLRSADPQCTFDHEMRYAP